ncbi:diphthine--ammonia ligase [Tachyglossus aculeatus]|uniref:diphthine--ammonia ligase n=1 Tax=Tachyglossus aculeatus TaxID=9261 RepID=UPI0018F4BA58|nr:diphthine--ammonia ligase [Tachyglossus aculeatus]
MRVAALVSGGKDSCYNMMQCVVAGHRIVALANLRPAESPGGADELDSYMYQTVGHQAVDLYAEALGLPLYRQTILGGSLSTGRVYHECRGDEVEDLYRLLKRVREEEDIEGVAVGAILSDYQRVRVENVCMRLGLQPLAYLWRRNQQDLLREMISSGIHAVVIKVAALGLDPAKHLGKSLEQLEPHLLELEEQYGVHPCGEGGEYETFTLDCPLFKKKVVVDSSEVVVHSADAFAPVAYLRLSGLHLEDKPVERPDKLLMGSCSCDADRGQDGARSVAEDEEPGRGGVEEDKELEGEGADEEPGAGPPPPTWWPPGPPPDESHQPSDPRVKVFKGTPMSRGGCGATGSDHCRTSLPRVIWRSSVSGNLARSPGYSSGRHHPDLPSQFLLPPSSRSLGCHRLSLPLSVPTAECSGKSPGGFQWIRGLPARFQPAEGDSVQEAARRAFCAFQDALQAEGLDRQDVLLVYLYVRDLDHFSAINSAYAAVFDVCPPARVCVEAPLASGVLLQMDCLAQRSGPGPAPTREVLQVQSVSHWAPASIGPYSQCVRVGELLCCSGQIALRPCTMQLVSGGAGAEARVALGHVQRILAASRPGLRLRHALLAHCYVTRRGSVPAALAAWHAGTEEHDQEEEWSAPGAPGEVRASPPTSVVVMVVPRLPREAAVEWHVVAVADEPERRRHRRWRRASQGWRVECQATEAGEASCIHATLSPCQPPPPGSRTDPAEAPDLLGAAVLQAVGWCSEAGGAVPLAVRAFYRQGSGDPGALFAGLRRSPGEWPGGKAPALVPVPVSDIPDGAAAHVTCWLGR